MLTKTETKLSLADGGGNMEAFLVKNKTILMRLSPIKYWLKRHDEKQITAEMLDVLDEAVTEHICNSLDIDNLCGELRETYVDESGNEIELSGWWGDNLSSL